MNTKAFNNITTVIFDLDGTLLDTLEDLTDSCNKTMNTLGLPEHTIDEVRTFVGNGLGVLIEKAIPDGKNNPLYEKAFSLMRENYAQNWQNKTRPYDGVLDLIAKLNERGIKTGIVSNKPDEQVKELAELYFKGFIKKEAAVGEKESLGIHRKPAPDSVYEVMKQLNAEKANCVYVGDSDVDLATARNAGIPCISVAWGFKTEAFLRSLNAQTIIHSPEEVLDLI